jgi:acyl-CoA reductase-like NAD-dependent aldehyde dehydrogenase
MYSSHQSPLRNPIHQSRYYGGMSFSVQLGVVSHIQLAKRAGVPNGVLNVITTEANLQDIGKELTTNPLIKKVSFTGSTRIGKMLAANCAGTMKKMTSELGGNAPLIVFEDADLPTAVAGTLASKFRGSGQTCVCGMWFAVFGRRC